MNAQTASKTYVAVQVAAMLVLVSAVMPGAALAQDPPRPRIQIIFDTSTSMKVAPDDPGFNVAIEMNQPGGDFDPLNPGLPCTSKFCIAKNVVYDTLPDFADEARIGLASYYQFLVKYDSPNTQYTRCYYDKMYKPGYSGPDTTFVSTTDYTGSLATVPSTTATPVFPSGSSGTGAKNGRCADPANGANRYVLTKIAANTTATNNCAGFDYPSRAVPFSWASGAPSGSGGATGCSAGITYTTKAASTVQNQTAVPSVGSAYTVQYIGPTGTSCSAAVPLSGMVPMTGPTQTLNAPPSIGTGVNQWEGFANANECNANSNCMMYSASSTYGQSNANQHQYSLMASAFVPATAPANLVSQSSNYGGTVTGNWVTQNGTTCLGDPIGNAVTYSTGAYTWGTFGITTAMVTASAGTGAGTNITPGWANPTCNANNQCRVTLTATMPVAPTFTPWTNINYNVPAAVAPEQMQQIANVTNGGNFYRKVGACTSPLLLSSNPATGGANNWVAGYAPTGCGAGRAQCSMVAASPSTTTMPNGCAPATRFTSTAPAACTGLDGVSNNYGAPTTTNLSFTINLPPGSSCPANGTNLAGPAGPGNECPSGQNCTITNNPVASPGPGQTSSTTRNRTTPPAGYSGAPTTTTDLSSVGSCAGTTGGATCAFSAPPAACQMGQFETSSTALCGAGNTPCTVRGMGLQNYGPPNGEVQERRCMYIRQTFSWSTPSVNCNIQIQRRVYPVNQNMTVCQYEQQRWQVRTQSPPQIQCRYSAPTARHNYTVVSNRWCEYYRMRTVYTGDSYSYTYQYTTKGGELLSRRTTSAGNTSAWWIPAGEHVETVNDHQLCGTAYNDASGFATGAPGSCPPVIDNCDGNNFHECRLRWGRPVNSGAGSGRYSLAISRDSTMCVAPDFGPAANAWHVATEAPSITLAASRFTGGGSNQGSMSGSLGSAGNPLAAAVTCQQDGAPAGVAYRLFSDWYQTGVANGAAPTNATVGPLLSGYTGRTWNNQATKESGWSGVGGNGASFPSGVPTTPAGNFVPIPVDTDPTGGVAALQGALGLCEQPNSSTVDPVTLDWPGKKGMCMVSDYFRNVPDIRDFTPLKGSLQNASDYLTAMRDADPDRECRDYYVILATDGLENTPANFTDPDLVSTVAGMRSHVPAGFGGNTTGIRTYVIGFGNLVSGTASASLDAMASAGGTGSAYMAADQASLKTALTLVLTQATAGTFSRSKPSLSTDGTRIYAGNFQRGLGANASPEWKGYLRAYAIDQTTGLLAQKWEYSDKLNQVPDNTRVLRTDVAGVERNFAVGQTLVENALESGVSAGLAGAPHFVNGPKIINFVRNPGVPGGTFQPYISVMNPVPERQSRAGAVEHSSAVVVGRSGFASDWGGTTSTQRAEYQLWQARTQACTGSLTPGVDCRPVRVLFGGSEGIMHAVEDRADTTLNPVCATDESDLNCPNGHERWGWVPSGLLPELHKSMMANQKSVDNTMAITDVCGQVSGSWPTANSNDSSTCDADDWFTIGLGTMRGGGREVFALKLRDDGTPRFMWNFSHPDLGTSWSVPVIARARYNGEDKFVAVFGGGMQCPTCGLAGDSMFVVDALTGNLIERYNTVGGPGNELPGRPAMFRRPANPFLDTVVIGGKTGLLYGMRFANTSAVQQDNRNYWAPSRFFDPTDPDDAINTVGNPTPILTIVRTPGWDVNPGATVPTYVVQQTTAACATPAICPVAVDNTLPLTITPPPVFNRPKVGTIVDGSGNLGDYYVGTGDVESPNVPAWGTNFFYALHDKNEQGGGGAQHDGVPLWVVRFPHANEQVVSEPVLVQGALVVATYIPPSSSSACALAGDTVLYSFDPRGGQLVPTLITPNNQPGAGTKTGVLKLDNFGIPSDLVAYKGNIAVNGSQGGLTTLGFEPPKKGGDIRSFRRIR
ncbi:MAG: hypothetical protein JNK82_22615 [Myxococcaceae bacterium]|nr:hypothetical protein [Myxococcaceae bacterium]